MTINRVEYLRRERVSPGAILRTVIRQFAIAPKTIFCFFEGQDAAYYDVRLRQELNGGNFVHHNCNGKELLRAVFESVTANEYLEAAHKLFFFDRDYDFDVDNLNPETCYVTDGYSVENYYASRDAFYRIIRSAFFHDQVYDERDQRSFDEILALFDRLGTEFHAAFLIFNAWAFVQRHRNLSRRADKSLNVRQPSDLYPYRGWSHSRLFAGEFERAVSREDTCYSSRSRRSQSLV